MTARRETGTPDLADQLSPAHSLTRLNQIAGSVVEGGLHMNAIHAAVAEEQPIAVSRIEECPGNHARVRRTNGRAATGGKVSAVVQFPDLEDWMETHPELGTHNTRHRMEEAVAARPSRRADDGSCLSRRGGRTRASLSRALHYLTLRLSHQPQPATATAEQEQRVEITLALPEAPVQAPGTMPTRSEEADHLSERDPIADAQRRDHGLIRGADRAVVNADDGFAGNRASKGYRAARRGQDGLTWLGEKINTAMPGDPRECWRSEHSLHHG